MLTEQQETAFQEAYGAFEKTDLTGATSTLKKAARLLWFAGFQSGFDSGFKAVAKQERETFVDISIERDEGGHNDGGNERHN